MAVSWNDLLELALTLPDTAESTHYGTPAAKVRGRMFLRLREDDESVVVLCSLTEKEALLSSGDPAIFTTSHYDGHGSVLLRLSEATLDAPVRELLTEAWRTAASRAKAR